MPGAAASACGASWPSPACAQLAAAKSSTAPAVAHRCDSVDLHAITSFTSPANDYGCKDIAAQPRCPASRQILDMLHSSCAPNLIVHYVCGKMWLGSKVCQAPTQHNNCLDGFAVPQPRIQAPCAAVSVTLASPRRFEWRSTAALGRSPCKPSRHCSAALCPAAAGRRCD